MHTTAAAANSQLSIRAGEKGLRVDVVSVQSVTTNNWSLEVMRMQVSEERSQKRAAQMVREGLELPAPSEISRQLFAYSHQPDSQVDIGQLSKFIEQNPDLTARLLEIANASYYGSFTRISDVRQAIMRIGVPETVSSLNWLACKKLIPRFPRMNSFTSKNYWAHSWVCGTANRMLGEAMDDCALLPGELYLTGLLHGVGQLLLAQHAPHEFQRCVNIWQQEKMPLAEAEFELLGTTDCHIAFELLHKWHLPKQVCHGIRHYRAPDKCPEEYRDSAAFTQFSYTIANNTGIGAFADPFCPEPEQTWLVHHGESPLADQVFRAQVTTKIYQNILQKAGFLTGVPVKQEQTPIRESEKRDTNGSGKKTRRPASLRRQSALSRIISSFKDLLS